MWLGLGAAVGGNVGSLTEPIATLEALRATLVICATLVLKDRETAGSLVNSAADTPRTT